jgi:hypothetical protein
MRRSHRNTSVLILTCLIRMSDGSRMTHLFWCVGCIRVSKEKEVSIQISPDPFSLHCLCSFPLVLPLCLPTIEENRRWRCCSSCLQLVQGVSASVNLLRVVWRRKERRLPGRRRQEGKERFHGALTRFV